MRGGKVSEDVVVPVERLAEALEGFAEIAARHGLRACAWGHGADGNVHANLLLDPSRERELAAAAAAMGELFALAVELGGRSAASTAWACSSAANSRASGTRGRFELHDQIKRAFDPKGLLNPGKKLARAPASGPVAAPRTPGA